MLNDIFSIFLIKVINFYFSLIEEIAAILVSTNAVQLNSYNTYFGCYTVRFNVAFQLCLDQNREAELCNFRPFSTKN